MAKISVIGMGYVGLVTAACFADLGNEVWCVELDGHKIELLRQNKAPFYEPGLEELIARNASAGRLHFTTRYEEAIPDSDFVFICVGTPMAENGAAELKYVRMAAESIGPNLRGYTIIVNKSTVPIGTGDMVTDILSRYADPGTFAVVSNPEFLREGSAVNDFFNPDRIVLGAGDRTAAEKVAELHAPLNAPVIITDLHTAEMIKYASNAFLATRISFINEIAHICERLGADVKEVARGMGMDRRIGPHFLNAGVGFGGSCFAGGEVVFLVNPPSVQPRPLAEVFNALEGGDFTRDGVEVRYPSGWYALSLDPATGQPMVTPILCVTRRPYEGVMVRLQARMGRKVEVTADHPIPVYRPEKDAFEIVPALEVQEGDFLATPIVPFPLASDHLYWLQGMDEVLQAGDIQRYGPLALLPVTSVSHYHSQEAVYSLETGNGFFVGSDGLLVHNCFPKDVRALAYMAKAQDCHPQLLQAVLEINEDARRRFVGKLLEMLGELRGRTIGVLGLSFKPNTDDMREAPSIEIITRIHEMGAEVKAYDPVAMPRAEEILPWVTYCATPYDVAKGADALLVVTEWNEFKQLNMERIRDLMREPVLLDGRNVYEPAEMRRLGFRYYGVGRP